MPGTGSHGCRGANTAGVEKTIHPFFWVFTKEFFLRKENNISCCCQQRATVEYRPKSLIISSNGSDVRGPLLELSLLLSSHFTLQEYDRDKLRRQYTLQVGRSEVCIAVNAEEVQDHFERSSSEGFRRNPLKDQTTNDCPCIKFGEETRTSSPFHCSPMT